jgi:hypothetical protein
VAVGGGTDPDDPDAGAVPDRSSAPGRVGSADERLERELSALARRVGEERVDAAVAERRRASWLARGAAGSTSLVALLATLAERSGPVVVVLLDGRRRRGRPTVVGADVVEVRTADGRVLVPTAAVASVRSPDRRPIDVDPGWPRPRTDLVTELVAWAEDQPWVQVRTLGSAPPMRGQLLRAGAELLALRLDGGDVAYVPLAVLAEVSLAESG